MPWSNAPRSARRATLPPNWPALRRACKTRAHGRCQRVKPDGNQCQAWGTDADHIIRGAGDSLDNLEWLCAHHHATKSSAEGHAAARAQRAKLRHPTERHPGLR